MAGVGESASGAAKILEVLKDLPLWVLTGLSVAAALLVWVPRAADSVPKRVHPWIVIVGVVCGVLAVARATGILIERARAWKASKDARKRFHLTAIAQQSFLSAAKQSDDSVVTQVVARLLVKNRTPSPLAVVRARLVKPKVRGEIVHEDVSIRAIDRNIYGRAAESGHLVPPDMSLPASVVIMIRGVLARKPGRQVRAIIGVKDDEGHEEKVALDMQVLVTPSPQVALAPSLEVVSSIPNPIEREVASVIQAELARYDKCGRRVGGLGSVHLVVGGREIIGVGNDSWNPNSPKEQSIFDNPDIAELRSDNLEALMAYYGRLATVEERDQFVSALLRRMDGKDYLRVTYFVVCVLWRVGKLRQSLEKAKADLPQGEIKAFGLGNVLMLLNGLLRYRYPDFTNEMLDDIEKFLVGLREHPFQIPEKIAAIRTARLLGANAEHGATGK